VSKHPSPSLLSPSCRGNSRWGSGERLGRGKVGSRRRGYRRGSRRRSSRGGMCSVSSEGSVGRVVVED